MLSSLYSLDDKMDLSQSEKQPDSRIIPILQPGDLFVGRIKELRKLRTGLARAISGQSQFFMIEGEAGIGKTRLARELASYAEKDHATVLWGRCYEDTGVPPYWPWIEIIRAYIDTRNTDELHWILGAGAGDIAEIVPQIREKFPSLPVSPKLEPAEVRFRLFDSIRTFIKRAADINPLVIVLDNMHCSDQSSLRLLEILAQSTDSTPLLVVGNCRNVGLPFNHPVTETLGELSRNPRFARIKAGALSEDEVAQFVAGFIDGEIAPEVIKTVHVRTDGNPLFVREIIRLFLEEPQLPVEDNLEAAVQETVEPGSIVKTDGWSGYNGLGVLGYEHKVIRKTADVGENLLPLCHREASLIKRWLDGTHQGAVSHEHLGFYLDEYTFRFNRRTSRYRGKLFYRLLQNAVAIAPTRYHEMIKGVRGRKPRTRHM